MKRIAGCLGIVCFLVVLLSGCSKLKSQIAGNQKKQVSPEVLINSIGMRFKLISAGSFLMGSPKDEVGRGGDEVQADVKIKEPFYLGIYEVTQEQYDKVMGVNPSGNVGLKKPVENVSWDDAQIFCRKLSKIEKRKYRLPTEAEWEYACRSGTKTAFYWGDTFDEEFAWGPRNSGEKSQEVGLLKPNAWGLYDMSGNVLEWCEDPATTIIAYLKKGYDANSYRAVRGGNWRYSSGCRSASRVGVASGNHTSGLGFRVVAVPMAERMLFFGPEGASLE